MILRDMPVETRNYVIVDNVTGKPIDQSNYTLTIDPEVIKRLNQLKKINEEKVKQAALRDKYGSTSIASTFTPKDNSVFTPLYNNEYINYDDINKNKEEIHMIDTPEKPDVVEQSTNPTPTQSAEVFQSDGLLNRVVARGEEARVQSETTSQPEVQTNPNLDYISNYTPEPEEAPAAPVDNSVFTPSSVGLQQASEQIVRIDPNRMEAREKAAKKPKKEKKVDDSRVKADQSEVMAGKKVAWTAYILFFIPLLFKRQNRFVRIHANEGLELNIVELLGGLMIAQYFLLPKLVEGISSTWSMVSLVACWVGVGLLTACIITSIIAIIASLCGNQNQTPWLWKKRMIHVSAERTDA